MSLGLATSSSIATRALRPASSLPARAAQLAGVTAALRPQRWVLPRARAISGIKILDDKEKAEENLYWAREDERLLRKMIDSHPELNPEYQGISGILTDDAHASVTDKVKMIFMKHGIPPVNKTLIGDIVQLVESKGK
mmetsp:Transcript_90824/g.234534  ORF Transcript_90824/g.234534 Transcript_90824/m.234534 type:complete len:138 (+) Transcript_90824:89-502(+)